MWSEYEQACLSMVVTAEQRERLGLTRILSAAWLRAS